MNLAPLPVVVPLLTAAVLIGAGRWLPRRVLDLIALIAAGSVLVICVRLTLDSADAPLVYWFGGWAPDADVPLGIAFVIDPLGAGLASLVSLLVVTSFLFSWRYFESLKSLYHALMLVFLAAMCGMCLTGDFFNLFVWFELMTAAGVTLCGYMAEETGPLEGALNFAVTNTVGAFMSLTGVALLYAQVGALNFAQAAVTLADKSPGTWFVALVFLLIVSGYLIKAAAFPFHLWLGDAHAVAPTPVCVLFSGVMVELGLFAVARVYWSVFALVLHEHADAVRIVFLTMGTLSALFGAVLCFRQRHLKRLLAFSTISHMGLMVIGFGLLDAGALAGTALYVIGHGLIKAVLFIVVGVLLHRFQSVDEYDLRGAGRRLPFVRVLIFGGALGLAGMPPFLHFFGEELIEDAAARLECKWLSVVFAVAGLVTAAAVLRVACRVFLGWGQERQPAARDAPRIPLDPETTGGHSRTPLTMALPPLVLLVAALVAGPWQELRQAVVRQAARMTETHATTLYVLGRGPAPSLPDAPAEPESHLAEKKLVMLIGVIVLALAGLYPNAFMPDFRHRFVPVFRAVLGPLRGMQSGRIGDYVAWLTFGIAGYGLLLVTALALME